jgi:hypothetical protein
VTYLITLTRETVRKVILNVSIVDRICAFVMRELTSLGEFPGSKDPLPEHSEGDGST